MSATIVASTLVIGLSCPMWPDHGPSIIALLTRGKGESEIALYQPTDNLKLARVVTVPVPSFKQDLVERVDPRTGPVYAVRLLQATISPNRTWLACRYFIPAFKDSNAIPVHNLLRGGETREVLLPSGEKPLWMRWEDDATLRCITRNDARSNDDLRFYDVIPATGEVRESRTSVESSVNHATFFDYEKLADMAAEEFRNLHVRPTPSLSFSGLFSGQLLGRFAGISTGAVARDGSVAAVWNYDRDDHKLVVVIEHARIIGSVRVSRLADIIRIEFINRLLVVVVKHRGRAHAEIWSVEPFRQIASIPGDFLVDYAPATPMLSR